MSHPDFFNGMMDWPVYGPRDSRIVDRVEELAALGQRLVEIEDVILAAPRRKAGRGQEIDAVILTR